jgi:hypothetical protein
MKVGAFKWPEPSHAWVTEWRRLRGGGGVLPYVEHVWKQYELEEREILKNPDIKDKQAAKNEAREKATKAVREIIEELPESATQAIFSHPRPTPSEPGPGATPLPELTNIQALSEVGSYLLFFLSRGDIRSVGVWQETLLGVSSRVWRELADVTWSRLLRAARGQVAESVLDDVVWSSWLALPGAQAAVYVSRMDLELIDVEAACNATQNRGPRRGGRPKGAIVAWKARLFSDLDALEAASERPLRKADSSWKSRKECVLVLSDVYRERYRLHDGGEDGVDTVYIDDDESGAEPRLDSVLRAISEYARRIESFEG